MNTSYNSFLLCKRWNWKEYRSQFISGDVNDYVTSCQSHFAADYIWRGHNV